MALLSLKGRDIFWLVGTSSEHHNRVQSKFYCHMILSSGIAFTYLTSEFCFISRLLGRLGRTLGQWMDYLKPLKHCLFSLDGKGEPHEWSPHSLLSVSLLRNNKSRRVTYEISVGQEVGNSIQTSGSHSSLISYPSMSVGIPTQVNK